MAILKCKMCGGALDAKDNQSIAECEYCGTKQTLPRLDDEHITNLYDRANHFRRSNEFDKAMAIYEQILNEDSTDAESYWSLVLCKYGIEYVEDPATHKRKPTVNRTQYTSIFADENYLAALEHADSSQRLLYEEEAEAIDEIQKGILEISFKENPFDVFICYKESDESGKRTADSVIAQDIYYQLIEKGFKVFFARITLESKLGQQYEPYIFAALNSAKVMVIVGTKAEYYNAVWVKNEWSRYLKIAQEKKDRLIIPAYKNMNPYDLPDALSYYQALDMSQIGFIQDLIRGIEKMLHGKSLNSADTKNVLGEQNSNHDALIKRGNMALEDGEWDKAFDFFEQVLNMDAECAEAYKGQALAKHKASNEDVFISNILNATEEVETVEHCFPELYSFYRERKQELVDAKLDFSGEFSVLPKFVYYTEQEGRIAQFKQQKDAYDTDKLIAKALRFSGNSMIFTKIEKNLFGEMQRRIDDAIELDSIRQKEAEETVKKWKDDFSVYVRKLLHEQERHINEECESAMKELNAGKVLDLKAMKSHFESYGNVGNAPQMTQELEEKIKNYEKRRDELREEYRNIMRRFSIAKKSLFGRKSKEYLELKKRFKEVNDELEKIDLNLNSNTMLVDRLVVASGKSTKEALRKT